MSTIENSRSIRALLGKLMGTFADEFVTAKSVGPTGLVPAFSFAVPVSAGFEEQWSVFVLRNTARKDGAWPVTEYGTLIPVQSMLGGEKANLPDGTKFRWFPSLDGIEDECIGGVPGAVSAEGLSALKQVQAYKNLGSTADGKAFFRAQLGEFPAVSLAWQRTAPIDGPMAVTTGPRESRVGQAGMVMRHSWILYVVTNRFDGEEVRRMEGDAVRDEVLAELFGRKGTRGLRISGDPGIVINDASVTQVTDTSFIDTILFETRFTMNQRIADADDAKPWLKTRVVRPVAPQNETQIELRIPDVTVSMEPPEPEPDPGP